MTDGEMALMRAGDMQGHTAILSRLPAPPPPEGLPTGSEAPPEPGHSEAWLGGTTGAPGPREAGV